MNSGGSQRNMLSMAANLPSMLRGCRVGVPHIWMGHVVAHVTQGSEQCDCVNMPAVPHLIQLHVKRFTQPVPHPGNAQPDRHCLVQSAQ